MGSLATACVFIIFHSVIGLRRKTEFGTWLRGKSIRATAFPQVSLSSLLIANVSNNNSITFNKGSPKLGTAVKLSNHGCQSGTALCHTEIK